MMKHINIENAYNSKSHYIEKYNKGRFGDLFKKTENKCNFLLVKGDIRSVDCNPLEEFSF
jgi:hypothetical protein